MTDPEILASVERRFREIGFFSNEDAVVMAVHQSGKFRRQLVRHLKSGRVMVNRIEPDGFTTRFVPDHP